MQDRRKGEMFAKDNGWSQQQSDGNTRIVRVVSQLAKTRSKKKLGGESWMKGQLVLRGCRGGEGLVAL